MRMTNSRLTISPPVTMQEAITFFISFYVRRGPVPVDIGKIRVHLRNYGKKEAGLSERQYPLSSPQAMSRSALACSGCAKSM